MADLRRAEKIASAKKRLKQFQQKTRDNQSESGRSTPSKKRVEDELDELPLTKSFHSENGGSTYSLSHSENLSSNISRTESPVLASNSSLDNICPSFNDHSNSQPDILNVSGTLRFLPQVNETFFQSPTPQDFFSQTPSLIAQSGSEFFDNLTSANNPSEKSSQAADLAQENIPAPHLLQNHLPLVNASTPDGPQFQDTPNYSFPDTSVSPITEMKSNLSREPLHNELELQLKNSLTKNTELEQQLAEQKNQILQLQSHLEDLKKRSDEGASILKHHVQAIEILVAEKTELQHSLDKRQEEIQNRTGEVEELQNRLRASRHRVSDLEKELGAVRTHVQTLETSLKQESNRQNDLLQTNDSLGKRVGDLELEVSDLRNKLENQSSTMSSLKAELQEKTSQLSLAEVRIQQLIGGPDVSEKVEEELRQGNEELSKTIKELESQLSTEIASKEESVKEYQQYVNRLHAELQEIKTKHEAESEYCIQLKAREQQLIQQVSELERQLNRIPQNKEDPAVQSLRDLLKNAEDHSQLLQNQLEQKSKEVEILQEGLQERAFRIQELEVSVERLETDRPDTATLQAAIESDKVAASRAIAQNNALKKQLEELQEALVKLSNNKLELTQQLHHEKHHSQDLSKQLGRLQESKGLETEKAQQTENPNLQESESQTTFDQPIVSPEAMIKLQEKFRKTMSELADLSDEKQRLEHLVMQLQSETETIGEYITLYQIQRGMLRQRAQEKDEQVARLAQDKEALRNKLSQLNCLVQRLVGSGATPQLNGSSENSEKFITNPYQESTEPLVVPTHQASGNAANVETAQQIQSLLSEIGSNNLVTSAGENMNINFHPCPWCSGRLITV